MRRVSGWDESLLALFETNAGHPMIAQQTGVAFSIDADTFISFARSLPGEINSPTGAPLVVAGDVAPVRYWPTELFQQSVSDTAS